MSSGNPFRDYWLIEATQCRARNSRNAFNVDYNQWPTFGREKAIVELFMRIGKTMDKEKIESAIRLLSRYAGEEWKSAKKNENTKQVFFWDGYINALIDIQSDLNAQFKKIPKV